MTCHYKNLIHAVNYPVGQMLDAITAFVLVYLNISAIHILDVDLSAYSARIVPPIGRAYEINV